MENISKYDGCCRSSLLGLVKAAISFPLVALYGTSGEYLEDSELCSSQPSRKLSEDSSGSAKAQFQNHVRAILKRERGNNSY